MNCVIELVYWKAVEILITQNLPRQTSGCKQVNIKVHCTSCHAQREIEAYLYSFFIVGDGWTSPRPAYCIPEKDPVPMVQHAGRALPENLLPTRSRIPNRPARGHSQYRLSRSSSGCKQRWKIYFARLSVSQVPQFVKKKTFQQGRKCTNNEDISMYSSLEVRDLNSGFGRFAPSEGVCSTGRMEG